MKNQNFPALVFLLLAYCLGFAIIALFVLPIKLVQRLSAAPKKSSGLIQNQSPNLVVRNATIAPIFGQVPVIDRTLVTSVIPVTSNKPATRKRKRKATISGLIGEEFNHSA